MDDTTKRPKGPPFNPGRCPECDKDLAGIDILAHANYHYPEQIDERQAANSQAVERRKELLKRAARQRRDFDVEDQ